MAGPTGRGSSSSSDELRSLAERIGAERGLQAAAWRTFAARAAAYPGPAIREDLDDLSRSNLAAADRVWVREQLARRSAYIARVATELGLDPAEAERRWRSGTFVLPGSSV